MISINKIEDFSKLRKYKYIKYQKINYDINNFYKN